MLGESSNKKSLFGLFQIKPQEKLINYSDQNIHVNVQCNPQIFPSFPYNCNSNYLSTYNQNAIQESPYSEINNKLIELNNLKMLINQKKNSRP